MLLAISTAALAQFAVYYWRAIVASEAARPVSDQVLAAASVESSALRGRDFDLLAGLYRLTPNMGESSSGLGLVPAYFRVVHAVGSLAEERLKPLARWAENERILCARFVAVQIDRRLQENLAMAASIRSC
ncbi:MAG TPA: hypothetical protein VMT51_07635 [Dongiaceae bacterium]|nr:hypothetical protein [Dongiaceae bacterium]